MHLCFLQLSPPYLERLGGRYGRVSLLAGGGASKSILGLWGFALSFDVCRLLNRSLFWEPFTEETILPRIEHEGPPVTPL
jgi:hypothetical protein